MSDDEVELFYKTLFLDAGFEIRDMIYHPMAFMHHPWFIFETQFGPIQIGHRKRVHELSWEKTMLRAIITEDDTTTELGMVHAWSKEDLAKYLVSLYHAFAKLNS